MSIKLLDDLELVIRGRATEVESDNWMIARINDTGALYGPAAQWAVRYMVQLSSEQIISETERKNPQADEMIRRDARRAIAWAIYGEIETELRHVLRDLWRTGLRPNPAVARIEKLLVALRGDDIKANE